MVYHEGVIIVMTNTFFCDIFVFQVHRECLRQIRVGYFL